MPLFSHLLEDDSLVTVLLPARFRDVLLSTVPVIHLTAPDFAFHIKFHALIKVLLLRLPC